MRPRQPLRLVKLSFLMRPALVTRLLVAVRARARGRNAAVYVDNRAKLPPVRDNQR